MSCCFMALFVTIVQNVGKENVADKTKNVSEHGKLWDFSIFVCVIHYKKIQNK